MAHAVHAMMATFRQGRGPTGDPVWNCTDAEGVYHKWFDDQRCMHTFFLHNSHAGGAHAAGDMSVTPVNG
jgi:hypothetical protein